MTLETLDARHAGALLAACALLLACGGGDGRAKSLHPGVRVAAEDSGIVPLSRLQGDRLAGQHATLPVRGAGVDGLGAEMDADGDGLVDLQSDSGSLSSAPDSDGDGLPDIAVGARNDDDGGSNRGAVYVLFLNADATVKGWQKISQFEGGFTGTLRNHDFCTNADRRMLRLLPTAAHNADQLLR